MPLCQAIGIGFRYGIYLYHDFGPIVHIVAKDAHALIEHVARPIGSNAQRAAMSSRLAERTRLEGYGRFRRRVMFTLTRQRTHANVVEIGRASCRERVCKYV